MHLFLLSFHRPFISKICTNNFKMLFDIIIYSIFCDGLWFWLYYWFWCFFLALAFLPLYKNLSVYKYILSMGCHIHVAIRAFNNFSKYLLLGFFFNYWFRSFNNWFYWFFYRLLCNLDLWFGS